MMRFDYRAEGNTLHLRFIIRQVAWLSICVTSIDTVYQIH